MTVINEDQKTGLNPHRFSSLSTLVPLFPDELVALDKAFKKENKARKHYHAHLKASQIVKHPSFHKMHYWKRVEGIRTLILARQAGKMPERTIFQEMACPICKTGILHFTVYANSWKVQFFCMSKCINWKDH